MTWSWSNVVHSCQHSYDSVCIVIVDERERPRNMSSKQLAEDGANALLRPHVRAGTTEYDAAFQRRHTSARARYLRFIGGHLVVCAIVRLSRVAMGVETAAGADSAGQIGAFVACGVLGAGLLQLSRTGEHCHVAMRQACDGAHVCVTALGTFCVFIVLSDAPQPGEVWLFFGAVTQIFPLCSQVKSFNSACTSCDACM